MKHLPKYLDHNNKYVCGIDLHARTMYVCILDADGKVLFNRNMCNDFQQLMKVVEKYRDDIVIGVESTFNTYWLYDSCEDEGIPCYVGHALYIKRMTAGKHKSDKIDARKIADLLRRNAFPLAYSYPKEMREARDLLRRRSHFVSRRAELYAHIQIIAMQQGIDDISPSLVKNRQNRLKLLSMFTEPHLFSTIETDLNLIEVLDDNIRRLEKEITYSAKEHDNEAYELLLNSPGVGDILSLCILYEIHTIDRFPSKQHYSSYCRVIKSEHSSAGKHGSNGKNDKIGNPHLKWAYGEVALKGIQHYKPIKGWYEKKMSKHGKRKARMILAHKFAVAHYYMLRNREPFNMDRFLNGS